MCLICVRGGSAINALMLTGIFCRLIGKPGWKLTIENLVGCRVYNLFRKYPLVVSDMGKLLVLNKAAMCQCGMYLKGMLTGIKFREGSKNNCCVLIKYVYVDGNVAGIKNF